MTSPTPVPAELVALAHQLADSARPIAARYFRTGVTVDDKTDQSPVTIADREAETAMRDLLTRHVPEHGVFGEEHGAVRTDADYVWVLDPIDGTKAFITGLPLFGTLIGALTLGVVNKFLEPYAGAVLGKILVLVFIIMFIQRRPRGLFALKGRSVE